MRVGASIIDFIFAYLASRAGSIMVEYLNIHKSDLNGTYKQKSDMN